MHLVEFNGLMFALRNVKSKYDFREIYHELNIVFEQCDQVSEGLYSNTAQMNEFCAEKGFAGWFETSAKENIGIDEAASFLVNKASIYFILGSLDCKYFRC